MGILDSPEFADEVAAAAARLVERTNAVAATALEAQQAQDRAAMREAAAQAGATQVFNLASEVARRIRGRVAPIEVDQYQGPAPHGQRTPSGAKVQGWMVVGPRLRAYHVDGGFSGIGAGDVFEPGVMLGMDGRLHRTISSKAQSGHADPTYSTKSYNTSGDLAADLKNGWWQLPDPIAGGIGLLDRNEAQYPRDDIELLERNVAAVRAGLAELVAPAMPRPSGPAHP